MDGSIEGDTIVALERMSRAPQRRKARATAFTTAKRQRFLDALALTCNVARSAAHAGITPAALYVHRAKDQHFAEQWRDAFAVGYDRLEALLLEHGGAGMPLEPADPARAEADGVVAPFDFDKALKVLQFHRAARAGAKPTRGRRPVRATREETNAALLKALAAAKRRIEKTRGADA